MRLDSQWYIYGLLFCWNGSLFHTVPHVCLRIPLLLRPRNTIARIYRKICGLLLILFHGLRRRGILKQTWGTVLNRESFQQNNSPQIYHCKSNRIKCDPQQITHQVVRKRISSPKNMQQGDQGIRKIMFILQIND